MLTGSHRHNRVFGAGLVVIAYIAMAPSITFAQSATRVLPPSYELGGPPVIVEITIDTPGGITAVGIEDRPPAGWTVGSISNSGSVDPSTGKVKWGPFFSPSIPASVTYELQPPEALTALCFSGAVSFDGLAKLIGGGICLPRPVPTLSLWGLTILACLMLTFATLILRRSVKSTKPIAS